MTSWFPPVWMKIMDPMVEAVQKGEKLSEKQLKEQKKILNAFYAISWTTLTLLQLFVFGIKIPNLV
jgi:hypothetical protein